MMFVLLRNSAPELCRTNIIFEQVGCGRPAALRLVRARTEVESRLSLRGVQIPCALRPG